MNILGINAYHGDSSACLARDGKLVAAVEEERFKRIKHWAGFPGESIRYCLKAGGISIRDVDCVAVNRNPRANFWRKALFAFLKRPGWNGVRDRLKNASRLHDVREALAQTLGVPSEGVRSRIHYVEHHRAHLASAFFVSGFSSAALLSVDGFGDFVSTMWGMGENSTLAVKGQVYFPHSLGLFYSALTQYLGFPHYGDEYKVMGLASYGRPSYLSEMRKIVRLKHGGRFQLDLDYFLHHAEGVSMAWENGAPVVEKVYSDRLAGLLGPARVPGEPLSSRHEDLAASVQTMYEEAFFHVLDFVYEQTWNARLCLAGGCAMNGVANGKILDRTRFKNIYVQAAAGDAGGAIGAAYTVWNQLHGRPRSFVMDHAYWGPEYGKEINEELRIKNEELKRSGCEIEEISDSKALLQKTAGRIAGGKVVGWFQGRMELGARALGNRSILCDPRRADMKNVLNARIKHRESFRPFAPSILRERTAEWFERDGDVAFMSQVYSIRPEKRARIPAVTHVDGSGRLQTVARAQNSLYYDLILEFEKLTGVPILLNTSFNENEPIVCSPREAVECFLRNRMDVLVMGSYFIQKEACPEE